MSLHSARANQADFSGDIAAFGSLRRTMKNGFVEEVRCFVAGRPAKRLHGIESFGCPRYSIDEARRRSSFPLLSNLSQDTRQLKLGQ